MRSMIKIACFAVGTALVLGGCQAEDAGDPDGSYADDYEFRGWTPSPDFWDWAPWYPGNGDLAIHEGTDVGAPECVIWDVLGTDVHEGAADPMNPPLLSVDDNEILGPDGERECVATWEGHLFKLRDADGNHVLTLWGRYMFDADVEYIPPPWTYAFKNLIRHHLAVEIWNDRIYLGPHWKPSSELVGTSTEPIRFANPMRKLLLGALAAGQCGSNGPPDPPPG